MRLTSKLAIAAAFAALAACGGNKNANNSMDTNASTDLNSGTADMNTTDMNAGGMSDMNATGNADMNAAAGAGNTGSATTNNSM